MNTHQGKATPGRARCFLPGDEGFPSAAYSYLLGLYLGDGYIASFPRTTCMRLFLDAGYPTIVTSAEEAMRRVMPTNRVARHKHGNANCVNLQCYSCHWPTLFPQHGPGRKHQRSVELADWQRRITQVYTRELVRGLLHSDGSRFTNTVRVAGRHYAYPRYQFTNVSADVTRIFCEHLDLLGVTWRRANARNISVARRDSVARLDAFVGPKR